MLAGLLMYAASCIATLREPEPYEPFPVRVESPVFKEKEPERERPKYYPDSPYSHPMDQEQKDDLGERVLRE